MTPADALPPPAPGRAARAGRPGPPRIALRLGAAPRQPEPPGARPEDAPR